MQPRSAQEQETIKQILDLTRRNNIQIIKLWFVDILGNLKSLSLSHREFEYAMNEGMGFDGSSVEGFARIYESDLVALPDLDTFQMFPLELTGAPIARFFCDIKPRTANSLKGIRATSSKRTWPPCVRPVLPRLRSDRHWNTVILKTTNTLKRWTAAVFF